MEITDKTIQDKFTTSPLTMQVKLEGMEEIQKDLKEMEKTLDLIIGKYELIKSYPGENEDLRNWIVDNFAIAGTDTINGIALHWAKENKWDEVEVELMVEEMVGQVEDIILNVIDTYSKEG